MQLTQHPFGADAWQGGKDIEQRVRTGCIDRDRQGRLPRLVEHPMRGVRAAIQGQAFEVRRCHDAAIQRAEIGDLAFIHLNHSGTICALTKAATLDPDHQQGGTACGHHPADPAEQPGGTNNPV